MVKNTDLNFKILKVLKKNSIYLIRGVEKIGIL